MVHRECDATRSDASPPPVSLPNSPSRRPPAAPSALRGAGRRAVVHRVSPTISGACSLAFNTHDFNGDRNSDIALARHPWQYGALVYERRGDCFVGGLLACSPWSIVGQRDFNGDGKYDCSGVTREAIRRSGSWMAGQVASTVACSASTDRLVGRRDRRTSTVTAWRHSLARQWRRPGDVAHERRAIASLPARQCAPVVGRRNRRLQWRRQTDLLWRDASGNTAIWFMNGAPFRRLRSRQLPTSWSVVGTGDFDGDGKATSSGEIPPETRRSGS